MNELKNEILKQQYWDNTYNKMLLKHNIDKDEMWKYGNVYKEDIVEQLFNGTYTWSIPTKVKIAKSGTNRKRVVYIYNTKDRYVLGVLYRAFSFYFADKISNNCFSYKVDTSTNDAIKFIQNKRTDNIKYGVKIDIHSYFNSVSEQRVKEMINELFNGGIKETIQNLMLNNVVLENNKEIVEFKSLIPGCALGSFFANYCLNEIDKYFDNINTIYARYSDDIILLGTSKDDIVKHLDIISKYISKYGLTINKEKYAWIEPGDDIQYLGLKLMENNKIDISDHAKQKIKKQIHRWCKKGRIEIESGEKSFEQVAKRIIHQLNNKNFKCYINKQASFGWCHYCYRYITCIDSLREIDLYTRDTLRAMKTGKHNKNNIKAITDEEFHRLGWVSLVELYMLYKYDFDYYCETIEII